MNLWIALVLFVVALVGDVTWAKWTVHVNKQQPFKAAFWAMMIVLAGAVSVDAYIHSRWYVLPLALGAGVGTWMTVWWAKRKIDKRA